MKQLLIAKTISATPSTTAGAISFYKFRSGVNNSRTYITDAANAIAEDFGIQLGKGANVLPTIVDEINFSTLTVTKSTPKAGSTFTAKMTIGNAIANKDYTIVIVKRGVVFNERNTWTVTYKAKPSPTDTGSSDTVTTIATALVNAVNANGSGLTASNSAGVITFNAASGDYIDYEIKGADMLMNVEATNVTHGVVPTLDKAYIKDLYQQCIGDEGIQYTDPSAIELQPNRYNDFAFIDGLSAIHGMYTLRFANKRHSARTTEDLVWQEIHIVSAVQIKALDTLAGIVVSGS